jgi:hypothetical protein
MNTTRSVKSNFAIDADRWLVRMNPVAGPPLSKILRVADFDPEDVDLFDSETELEAHEAWLRESDDGRPKIIRMRKEGDAN